MAWMILLRWFTLQGKVVEVFQAASMGVVIAVKEMMLVVGVRPLSSRLIRAGRIWEDSVNSLHLCNK